MPRSVTGPNLFPWPWQSPILPSPPQLGCGKLPYNCLQIFRRVPGSVLVQGLVVLYAPSLLLHQAAKNNRNARYKLQPERVSVAYKHVEEVAGVRVSSRGSGHSALSSRQHHTSVFYLTALSSRSTIANLYIPETAEVGRKYDCSVTLCQYSKADTTLDTRHTT